MSADARLSQAFQNAPRLPMSNDTRYILFSDCHRGAGTANDNFLKNQNLYFAALNHYYKEGYTYIELGDGDELWENRSIETIKSVHNNVFWLLSRYYKEHRLWMIYGNHDMVKKFSRYTDKNCTSYQCSANINHPLFPGITFHSGIVLEDCQKVQDIYLIHGHQADTLNSVFWKLSRFLVRYCWKPLEQVGFLDPTSAAVNYTKKEKTERILSGWAADHHCCVVAGHTHRPMIGTKESPYFNTGSCVHPRCITGIELVGRCLTLVKWTLGTREDMSLYVTRERLAGPVCLDEY